MPLLELFDETLDINSTRNYELVLQFSEYEIAYALIDRIRDKFILIRTYEPDTGGKYTDESLRETITRDDFLSRQYSRVTLLVPAERYTLVPSQLYDPARRDEYFDLNLTRRGNEVLMTEKVTEPDLSIIYATDNILSGGVISLFPAAMLMHRLKPLMNIVSASGRTATGNVIHLHFEKEYFDIIVYGHNKLRFCNSFPFRNQGDAIYYTLNVLGKLDAGRDETIWLSGRVAGNDETVRKLKEYYRTLRYREPSGRFTFSYVFGPEVLYRYLVLLQAAQCV